MSSSSDRSARATPHIIIIGTGFGGLGMAIQLKRAGIDAFTLLEKADRVGGTWRDNTYPGAACDVESHLYSFSFEPKHDWSRKFGDQAEILDYLQACAKKHGLYDHMRFGCEVTGAAFDDAQACWRLTLADGTRMDTDVLVTACGQLNRPAWPDIPGRDVFAGPVFHSAQWDHDARLDGRRVGVIGTGASAIQFVPQLVPRVAKLTLCQRSGAWVVPKPDRAFSRFEQALFRRVPGIDRLYRALIYWKNESRALAFTRFHRFLDLFAWRARGRMRAEVRDTVKRRALVPNYRIGCKRILMSNDWYPAVDADHVDLVTDAIDHIERDAVVTADGTRHEIDALIVGTGFHATEFLAPMQITGRDGRELGAVWRDGAEAYKGISVAGFPNLFLLYGPNTNLAHSSIVFMLEAQIDYVLRCVRALSRPEVTTMDVRADRQAAYRAEIGGRLDATVWAAGCDSWYLDATGRNTNNWPGFTFSFRRMTGQLNLDDYELGHGRGDASPRS